MKAATRVRKTTPPQLQAPEPLSVDEAIALSRRIIGEDRAATKGENDAIHEALNRGNGDRLSTAALQAFCVHVDIKQRQALAESQRASEAARIADLRANWAGRPRRWRALSAESRALFVLARFCSVQQGAAVDECLRRGFVAAAEELAQSLDEVVIPHFFEEPLVTLAMAEGVSRSGEQKWSDNP